MKKLVLFVLLVLGVSEILSAQGRPPFFNEAWLIKDYSSWLSTTANDTIPQPTSDGTATWLTLSTSPTGSRSGPTNLVFFGRVNDSTAIQICYQLRNSTLGSSSVTSWTELDTLIVVSSANADVASVVGRILLSTLSGYDQIRFYEDFLSGTATNSDGTTNRLRYYLYLLKNENR